MSKVLSVSAAALALALATQASHAAISVSLTPVITAAFAVNADGTEGAPLASIPDITKSEAPAFYQVDFMVNVSGADSTHSLGGIAFGLDGIARQSTFLAGSGGAGTPATATQGLSPVPGGKNTDNFSDANSNPVTLQTPASAHGLYDALVNDGSTPAGYFYEGFVVSGGSSTNFTGAAGDNNALNLEAMAFSLKSGKVTTAQRTIGQTSAFDVGDITLYWDGSSNQTLAINSTVAPGDGNLQYTVDTFASSASTAAGTLGNAQFVANPANLVFSGSAAVTPEPASLGVLALGGVALLARRKKA